MAMAAVCIDNEGYKASLELGKLYRIRPDKEAQAHGLVRVIDESGEDYAYSSDRFHSMKIPSFPMAVLLDFWGGVQNGFWAFGHNPTAYARSVGRSRRHVEARPRSCLAPALLDGCASGILRIINPCVIAISPSAFFTEGQLRRSGSRCVTK